MTLAWASDQSPRRWAALVAMARQTCDQRPDEAEPHVALAELLIGARRWSQARTHIALCRQRFPDHPRMSALVASQAQESNDGAPGPLEHAVTEARLTGRWDQVARLCATMAPAVGGSALRHYAAVAAVRLEPHNKSATGIDATRDSNCASLPLPGGGAALHDLLVAIDRHCALDQHHHRVATRDAWQSELLAPLDHPTVAELYTVVQLAVDAFLASRPWLLPPPQIEAWEINGWAVRYPALGHQASHVHPDAWLSAVFAVVTPPGSQALLRLGALDGGPDADLGAAWPIVELAMEPGELVIFPSWMPHAATRTGVAGERVVIALDVVPQGGWQRD